MFCFYVLVVVLFKVIKMVDSDGILILEFGYKYIFNILVFFLFRW